MQSCLRSRCWASCISRSTVFILAPAGAEGARRSWAFTWIGLCILAAPAVVWLLDWIGQRARQWSRASLRSALLAALAISLVGGTAAGLNAAYRFPGPFLYGSDTRSITSRAAWDKQVVYEPGSALATIL